MSKYVDREFTESADLNVRSYTYHFYRLINLYMSRFKWHGIPATVDPRYLELALLADGRALFFHEEGLGYLALRFADNGKLDVYNNPIRRKPIANNGYNFEPRTKDDSVIIYNNMSRMGDIHTIRYYSKKLYDIDRAIDVNISAQRTPTIIKCNKKTKLSMQNLMMKYEGNQNFIYVDETLEPKQKIEVLKTDTPYVADKLQTHKNNVFNDCLTDSGISNINLNKKERMITDEVERSQGGTIASRNSELEMRNFGAEQINRMFNFTGDDKVWVEFLDYYDEEINKTNEFIDEVGKNL